jgi:sRNA-binding carbon storage regulator CsrA
MLVLTRKSQETVVIGGADGFECLLKVTVLRITDSSRRKVTIKPPRVHQPLPGMHLTFLAETSDRSEP